MGFIPLTEKTKTQGFVPLKQGFTPLESSLWEKTKSTIGTFAGDVKEGYRQISASQSVEQVAQDLLSKGLTPPFQLEKAKSWDEWLGNVAKGGVNLATLPVQMPAQIAYSLAGKPLQTGIEQGAVAGIKEAGKGALDVAKGFGEFFLSPVGYQGYKKWAESGFEGKPKIWEAIKTQWATDPVFSALAFLPAIKKIGRIVKKTGKHPTEVINEIKQEAVATQKPVEEVIKAKEEAITPVQVKAIRAKSGKEFTLTVPVEEALRDYPEQAESIKAQLPAQPVKVAELVYNTDQLDFIESRIQTGEAGRTKPIQKDMFGATETGLEGKLPSEEIKKTPLEQATEEAKTRDAQKGQLPIEESIGAIEDKRRWSERDKIDKGEGILSVNETLENVRGKTSEGNWAVDYEVPSTLGKTGKQTNTKYFWRKQEALDWVNTVKSQIEEKPFPASPVEVKGTEGVKLPVEAIKEPVEPLKASGEAREVPDVDIEMEITRKNGQKVKAKVPAKQALSKAETPEEIADIWEKIEKVQPEQAESIKAQLPKQELPVVEQPKEPLEASVEGKSETVKLVENLYQEAVKEGAKEAQTGAVSVPEFKIDISVKKIVSKTIDNVSDVIKKFRFYKDVPNEFRNDIRTDLIGGSNKLFEQKKKLNTILYGQLKPVEVKQALELIYARDALSRLKIGKGNPELTIEEISKYLSDIEKSITNPEVFKTVEKWKTLADTYSADLVKRGKLDADSQIEDYAPHYTEAYTPEWAPKRPYPTKLRKPYRTYTREAKGSSKEYRKDAETLIDHLIAIEHDNLVEDFIKKQAGKYDIFKKLTKEQKEKYGVTGGAKSGRLYEIDGKKYWGYNPDRPFNRVFYPTETGEIAIGRQTKTYLVPEQIYKTFEAFAPKGTAALHYINTATSYWKEAAILSHFPSFNIANIVGDTWMLMLQHPEPLKVTRYIDNALKFLVKKEGKTAYDLEFAKFLSDNDVIGALFIHELPHIQKSGNPVRYILDKAWQVSEFRESIIRTANAMYLFDAVKSGRGKEVMGKFDWVNTEGLTENKAAGKIAREILIDYNAVNKTYSRWIRGFLAPFGRFYFGGTKIVLKYAQKHPIKALGAFLALPAIAIVFNNRNDETRELEGKLPDDIRERVHFVLGEAPDGTIRTLTLQTPQDVLIGTKIFSIASAQANMVLNKEKTVFDAAKDTLKHWGVKEVRGVTYLLTPVVRFTKGLIDDKDPYDNQPVYPVDKSKLSSLDQKYYEGLFFIKTMVPFLGAYTAEVEGKVKTPKQAITKIMDNFVGKEALGIRDFSEKNEIIVGGKKINYETYQKLKDIEKKEVSIMLDIRDNFVKSGLMPAEYFTSQDFGKGINALKSLHQGALTPAVIESLKNRINNELLQDPSTYRLWVANKIDTASTDKEKAEWRQMEKKAKTWQMMERFKGLPVSIRPHLLEEAEKIKEKK